MQCFKFNVIWEYINIVGICQDSLVGVGMVHIVLDPPGLKRVYEGGKHEGPHNVLHQLVFAERSVPTVMSNNEELHASIMLSRYML